MNAGLHSSARIATAVWGATLPPETTATAVPAASSSTFPASRAAVETAPAGSHASFARSYRKRKAAVDVRPRRRGRARPRARGRSRSVFSPAKGALSPSATDVGSTGMGSPASSAPCIAGDSSGSTPTTRTSGRGALDRGRDAGDQAAAADRDDDRAGVGHVLEELEPEGARGPRSGAGRRRSARTRGRSSTRSSSSRSKASPGDGRLQVDLRAVLARRRELGLARATATSRRGSRCPRARRSRRATARRFRPRW